MKKDDLRILVVDDFSAARAVVKNALKQLGYTNLAEAEDGREAFNILIAARAENRPFTIVVTDWSMPRMDGLQLLKACKQSPELASIFFIMVTAESETKNALLAIQAGAADFMVKPISPEKISERIEKLLKKM